MAPGDGGGGDKVDLVVRRPENNLFDTHHTPRGLRAAILARTKQHSLAIRICPSSDERRLGCIQLRALRRDGDARDMQGCSTLGGLRSLVYPRNPFAYRTRGSPASRLTMSNHTRGSS